MIASSTFLPAANSFSKKAFDSSNTSATAEFKIVNGKPIAAEDPHALNSNLFPVKAKGLCRLQFTAL